MAEPHDPPSAEQLVESVREWLETDVLPVVSGRLQFHTRVAINILAMVEREMELGPEQSAEHRANLERLGFGSDVELAASIRRGECDHRMAEIEEAVFDAVVNKVAVANPKYLRP
jgi:hypothetical protein